MRRAMMVLGGLTFAACGGGGEGGGEAGGGGETAAATAAMGTATVTGTVAFTGMVPENPTIDMTEEPACREKYAEMPRDPEVVVNNGMLANVFVYVKSGLPADQAFPRPAANPMIDQDGCLYQPRVVGVMVGQPLTIRNSDPLLHNIKAAPTVNRGFNVSQPQAGMTREQTFSDPEIMVPLECNVHGWMNAFVGVVAHPFFAVSGEDGTFTIGGLPAGTYELEAWHEKFGTRSMSVTVADGASASADFSYSAN